MYQQLRNFERSVVLLREVPAGGSVIYGKGQLVDVRVAEP